MTTPPQKSILKQPSMPPADPSSFVSRTARIVLSEDEDDDHPHEILKYVSDGDDEDPSSVPSGKALELLQTEKVRHSGYLLKKGEKRRTWKKRWFVLRTTKLAMYKDDKEYKLLRMIDMHEIHSVVEVTSKNKYKHVFAIITPKRMYYVQADDAKGMKDWIDTIETAKKELPLYDAEDDASSVGRDKEHANDVITSLNTNTSLIPQQRRRSSGGTAGDRTGRTSVESGDQGAASHVSPVDIPKNNHGAGTSAGTPHSDYMNEHAFPLSPNSDHQAQLHVAEGLVSSEDDEDYGLPTSQHAKGQDQVVIEGYLHKLGRNKTWKKRWFVLRSNSLAYYEDEKEYDPHRVIPLTCIIDSLEIEPISKSKRFCFKVIIEKRSFVLCAKDEDTMDSWLNVLSVTVRRAKKDTDAKPDTKLTSSDLPHRPLSLIPENADSNQQLQRLSSVSTAESFENTSHLSGVSGAGGVGGAGGALGEAPPSNDLARIHSRASERLGRAK